MFLLCVLAVSGSPAQELSLSAIVVRGGDAYSQLQFLDTYRAQLGQPIVQANVDAIVRAIAELYRRDGYAPPDFQIDTTQLAGGILGIEVFEAQIIHVIVTGSAGPYRQKLEALGEELRLQRPLRQYSLQRAIGQARRLSGLTVEASTKPDSRRNSFVLTMDARFNFLDGQVRFTNRGTREVGREFLIGQMGTNGLFGRDIKAGVLFGVAVDQDEFRGGGAFIEGSLGQATRVTITGFRSLSNPSEHPIDADYDYDHNRASLNVSHRWDADLRVELLTVAAFELDDQYIERAGVELQADRLRIVGLSTQGFWSSGDVQYVTVLGLRHGLDSLGAGLDTIVQVEDLHDDEFTIAQLQAIRVDRIGSLWQLRVDAVAQYSGDVLPDRERFKIGGERLGRGFEVPAIAGDRGLGAKFELRRDLPVFGQRFGQWSGYAAYDIAAAWRNELSGRSSAATGSAGIAMQARRFSGYLELARPLTHPDIDGNKSTLLVVDLTARF